MIAIYSNTAHDRGGLYLDHSPTLVTANIIRRNTAIDWGELHLFASDAQIKANTVCHNLVFNGGLYLTESPALLDGNTISHNYGNFSGGGMFVRRGSHAMLVNNIVVKNQSGNVGGGLYVYGTSPRLLHTRLVYNSSGSAGEAIYIVNDEFLPGPGGITSTVMLTNVIIAHQTVGIRVEAGNVAHVNGVLWFGHEPSTAGPGITTVNHATTGDPAFVNAAEGDYHIRATSAAVDAGIDSGVATDVDG